MTREFYVQTRFSKASLTIIEQANEIIEEYREAGFDLTLRQLYYQFVSRDLLENTVKSYNRLGDIISNARLAGLIDWDSIVDRTRNLVSTPHWSSPRNIVRVCAGQFQFDKWKTQEYRPEVWIEKEALSGVFEIVCSELDIPYFACRGYTSQSEMWAAGKRFLTYQEQDQKPIVLHFGDHDPSGIDMTRDIRDRLALFTRSTMARVPDVEVRRIALNRSQVQQYNPPPNAAKTTDVRFQEYERVHGNQSWELDALDPQTLVQLVRTEIAHLIDQSAYDEIVEEEQEARRLLSAAADRWEEVVDFLG